MKLPKHLQDDLLEDADLWARSQANGEIHSHLGIKMALQKSADFSWRRARR